MAKSLPPTSDAPPAQKTFPPDQSLPPVEPPSAGFILQLFIIPSIIVAIIAVVWLLFSWLAHMGSSPEKMVQNLERGGDHSWQEAYNLAEELRKPGNEQLRRNTRVARQLADLLQRHLAESYPKGATHMDRMQRKGAIQLRIFLSRVLGEFEVPEVVDVLVQAANQDEYVAQDEDDFGDLQVRRSAIEAIAVLAHHVDRRLLQENEPLYAALDEAASSGSDAEADREQQNKIREVAAFAFGVLGGKRNLNRLATMCSDGETNVRYNAAVGMARHGDLRSVDILLEMLELDQTAAIGDEPDPAARQWKSNTIFRTALSASKQLVRHNDAHDLSDLRRAVETLTDADVNTQIQGLAREVLKQLEKQ